jgi:hypothetical protein
MKQQYLEYNTSPSVKYYIINNNNVRVRII